MTGEERERLQRWEQAGQLVLGLTHDFNNTATCVLDELVRLERQLQLVREVLPAAGSAAIDACDRSVAWVANAIQAAVAQMRELQRLYHPDPGPRPPEGANLAEAARRALNLLGGRVQVLAQLHGSAPIRAAVKAQTLVRVLVNLLLNAIDAFGPEAPAPRIRLQMRLEAGRAICDVSDNGPGVSPEIRERLFQPFTTTRAAAGGTGLGLAVSRDLIRGAGGDLLLLETGPAGTVFRLWLPAIAEEARPPGKAVPVAEILATAVPASRPRPCAPPAR
jgi:C4-dicarboxylate-specific signal transduction histidine kinase